MTELACQTIAKCGWLTKRNAVKSSIVIVVGLLVYICFLLNYHYVITGYWKGQPCYKGLPADYWKARIEAHRKWGRDTPGANDDLFVLACRLLLYYDPLPLEDGRKKEVLLYLVKDEDWDVRFHAAAHLASIEPPDDEIIDALIEGMDDQAIDLICLAGLRDYGPRAGKAVPKLLAMLEPYLPLDRKGGGIENAVADTLLAVQRSQGSRFKANGRLFHRLHEEPQGRSPQRGVRRLDFDGFVGL